MRVAIATVQVPFISGGAELQTQGLHAALQEAGHKVEVVTIPFRFSPCAAVSRAMDAWAEQDFSRFDCGPIDTVLALRFPSIYLQHPDKRVWLMHQHRAVYELYGTPYGENPSSAQAAALREDIQRRDTAALRQASRVFTTSREVSDRLLRFNGVASEPLLHPPARAAQFRSGEIYPYVFFPSRLESLKRQDLLLRAMAAVSAPVFAVFAGEGGQSAELLALVRELGLGARVRFLGRIDDARMLAYYSHALAVFFGPYAEDYGYVTLEAMLSGRPVITCSDSGGPLQFVRDGETGLVAAPTPDAVADAIRQLWADQPRAARMGRNGRALYESLDITWARVVQTLLPA